MLFAESLGVMISLQLAGPIVGSSDPEVVQQLLFKPSVEDLQDDSVVFAIKMVNIVVGILKVLLGVFILRLLFGHPIAQVGNKRAPIAWLLMAVVMLIAANPLIDQIQLWFSSIPVSESLQTQLDEMNSRYENLSEAFMARDGFLDILTNILLISLLAAVWEELYFRALLQRLIHRISKNAHVGIWLGAILFGLSHLEFSQLISRIMLGAVLGYAYYWTGSLWTPIILHFVNNSLYMILVQVLKVDPSWQFPWPNIVTLLVASCLFIAMAYLIYRRSKQSREAFETDLFAPIPAPLNLLGSDEKTKEGE